MIAKQEGNVLQEPAVAMNLMFALKGLYNVAMKSVSRKEMVPKFHIMWSLSKITIRCPGYIPLFQYNHFAKIIISCLSTPIAT